MINFIRRVGFLLVGLLAVPASATPTVLDARLHHLRAGD